MCKQFFSLYLFKYIFFKLNVYCHTFLLSLLTGGIIFTCFATGGVEAAVLVISAAMWLRFVFVEQKQKKKPVEVQEMVPLFNDPTADQSAETR